MRYPTLTLSACRELAEERMNSPDHQPSIEAQWVGEGDDLNLDRLKEAAKKCVMLLEENRSASDQDPIEGEAAKHLHNALRPANETQAAVPIPVLDDPRLLAVPEHCLLLGLHRLAGEEAVCERQPHEIHRRKKPSGVRPAPDVPEGGGVGRC